MVQVFLNYFYINSEIQRRKCVLLKVDTWVLDDFTDLDRRKTSKDHSFEKIGVFLLTEHGWFQPCIFLSKLFAQVPPLYGLDGSDLQQWDNLVRDTAASIVAARLAGTAPLIGPLPPEAPLPDGHEPYTCSDCQRLFIGKLQWNAHQKSAKHQRVLKRLKRLAEKSKTDVVAN